MTKHIIGGNTNCIGCNAPPGEYHALDCCQVAYANISTKVKKSKKTPKKDIELGKKRLKEVLKQRQEGK